MISNTSITYSTQVQIIDNSNSNIVKSTTDSLTATITGDFTKELNKQTNTATYSGQGLLITKSKTFNVNLNAIVYSNVTGIVETKQQ